MARRLRFYIASKLDNAKTVKRLATALKCEGHCISYDWTVHGRVYDSIRYTLPENMKRMTRTAVDELEGIKSADVVIVLLPGGRGTHVELGAACAMRKAVIICAEEPLHLDVPYPCCFHWHPAVVKRLYGPMGSLGRLIVPRVVECVRELTRHACRACLSLQCAHGVSNRISEGT